MAERNVNVTESPQDENRRNDKERAGCDSAPRFVEKPSYIDSELLRFRAGQQHAKIQGVKKMRFADPFLFFHQLGVHHRDLPARSAEGDESKLEPKSQRFGEIGSGLPSGMV